MLNERQQNTYELIKSNSQLGIKTTQKAIFENYSINQFPDGYVWTNGKSHDHCSAIWSDIEKINKETDIEEIILTHNFTYWVAENKEKAMERANVYMSQALRKFKRYWNIVKKVDKNGQGQLDFQREVMEFYNSYAKED